VTDRLRDPPGPIDNKAIIATTVSRSQSGAPLNIQMLRTSSDYVQVNTQACPLLMAYWQKPQVCPLKDF